MVIKDKTITALIIGAGDRGMYKFGELSKREDIDLKVIAVAEPNKKKEIKWLESIISLEIYVLNLVKRH